MARNPFAIPKVPGTSNKLPSDTPLNPKPVMVGQEHSMNPEDRKMRFKRLAGILARRPQPSPALQPSPIMPPQTQKMPKF